MLVSELDAVHEGGQSVPLAEIVPEALLSQANNAAHARTLYEAALFQHGYLDGHGGVDTRSTAEVMHGFTLADAELNDSYFEAPEASKATQGTVEVQTDLGPKHIKVPSSTKQLESRLLGWAHCPKRTVTMLVLPLL